MKTLRVPEPTIGRISIYSRFLERLDHHGVNSVSSVEIADGVGVSPAQVRKDLAYFGEFGTRGVGYNVKDLIRYTSKILGLDKHWNLVIVGAGNLGIALCTYKGFNQRGFKVAGIFDNNPSKTYKLINQLPILPMEKMPDIIKNNDVKIGVITTPADAAPVVADFMVSNGIKAILNFASQSLNVPNEIEVRNVDLSLKLELLSFTLSSKK